MVKDQKEAYSALWGELANLLRYPGICIGEEHVTGVGSATLADSMGFLKQQGVRTLFLEHFEKRDQGLLDKFCEGRASSDELINLMVMRSREFYKPGSLPPSSDDHAKQHLVRTVLPVLEEARSCGIKIYGIDENISQGRRFCPSQKQEISKIRDAVNPYWVKVIREHQNEGKYIVFGGAIAFQH